MLIMMIQKNEKGGKRGVESGGHRVLREVGKVIAQ